MKNVFFITGLPRSRTAWLANFFTHGNSFCWHDAMRLGMKPHAVVEQLKRASTLPGIQYVGDSDSGVMTIARELQLMLPEARWLVVHRSRDEARKSYDKFFGSRPYPEAPKDTRTLDKAFDALAMNLARLTEILEPGSFIECQFDELDSKLVLEEAWRFLTPGNPWNPLRCELLQGLQVNVMPEKVVLCR